jgi:hypothetical protein
MSDDLIEVVAEVIYRHEAGMTDEEYEESEGKPRRAWKTDDPWDSSDDELNEWERDEYRLQAEAVIRLLKERNLLPLLS